MAIGIGHMLGFTYPPNFQSPYSAQSITDFWRRWHISLSSWFRDYVYIPLGGNRRSNARTYFNLAIVFFLCGLWHGAAWTFVVWGLWHGALLIIERLGVSAILQRLPRPVAQLYVLVLVMTGWVFFRAPSMSYAFDYLQVLYRIGNVTAGIPWQMHITTSSATILFVGLAIGMTRFEVLVMARQPLVFSVAEIVKTVSTIVALVVCIGSLAAGTYNPFIYFHF
jgi:alginate O-acetyltransferase complex protein AlgI